MSAAFSGTGGRRSLDAVVALVALGTAVVLGWAVGTSHLVVAVAVVLVVSLVLFLTVAPWWPLPLLAFALAAVPKAGFQVGSFPVPVLLPALLVGLLAIVLRRARRRSTAAAPRPRSVHQAALVGLITLWALLRAVTLAATGAPVGVYLPLLAWVLAPCVILVVYPIGSRREQSQWITALDYGFLTAAAFALLQFVRGADSLIVPGVTLAYGADYATKNNNLTNTLGSLDQISKIPSTYQSGNVFGIAAAFFFAVAATRIAKRTAVGRDYVVAAAALGCVLVSGSRTALVACVVGAVAIILVGTSVSAKLTTIALLVAAYAGLQLFLPGLAPRYSLSAIVSGGGSGRVEQWSDALSTFPPTTWLFGTFTSGLSGSANPLYEGWVGVLQQIGLVGVGLAVALVWVVTRQRRTWRLILVVIAVGSILDSTYIVFPTLFLPAARMLAGLAPQVATDEPVAADEPLPVGRTPVRA